MAKTNLKIYKIEDPIYRAHLSLLIGDIKEIKKYLLRCDFPQEKVDEISPSSNGRFMFHNEIHVIIMKEYNIYTLIHEIIHVAFAVMYGRGIPINYNNDETITYYVEMVLKNSLKKLGKNI